MRIEDITEEDRELYEELFGMPLFGAERHLPIETDLLDTICIIPRVNNFLIDRNMGTSGTNEELLDNYKEDTIAKYEAKLRAAELYKREISRRRKDEKDQKNNHHNS